MSRIEDETLHLVQEVHFANGMMETCTDAVNTAHFLKRRREAAIRGRVLVTKRLFTARKMNRPERADKLVEMAYFFAIMQQG